MKHVSRRPTSVPTHCLIRVLAFAYLGMVTVSAAHAQTIVPNPRLDTQLAPWAAFFSSPPDPVGGGTAPSWQAMPDVNGSAASGSALIHVDASTPATHASSGMAQCFDFAEGTVPVSFVNYGMAFSVPPTTAVDGSINATVEIRLFANAGCNGFLSGGTQGQDLSVASITQGTWYRLSDTGFEPLGAPVDAASVQVRGYLRQTGASPSQTDYAINLDHFVVVLNSTTPVELLHFEVL